MTIHWKAVEQYFTVVLFVFFNFNQFVILENLLILYLGISGMKGLNSERDNSSVIVEPSSFLSLRSCM